MEGEEVQPQLTRRQLRLAIQQLSLMLNSGLGLVASLETLETSWKGPESRIFRGVVHSLESGRTVSKSLALFPSTFPKTIVAFATVGESTGSLHKSFEQASTWLEAQDRLRRKLVTVFRYPASILVVAILSNLIILKVCMPQLLQMLAGFDIEIPIFSRIVFGLGSLLTDARFLIAVQLLLLAFFALRKTIITPDRRRAIARALQGVPLLGDIVRTLTLSRIAQTLSLSFSVGLDTIKCLELALSNSGSPLYQQLTDSVIQRVNDGSSLSQAFEDFPELFPPVFCQYLEVGVETGLLERTCAILAEHLELEAEYRINVMAAALEPLMLAFCSVLVAFFVIAAFLPTQEFLRGLL